MSNISLKDMINFLHFWEKNDRWYFHLMDAALFFKREMQQSLKMDLQYYIEADMIEYVGENIYAFRIFGLIPFNSQEILVHALRPLEMNYISFESMLNKYGIISQIPTILTVATTGISGYYRSKSYGIEFRHIDHDVKKILDNSIYLPTYKIRTASPLLALEDQKNMNYLLELIDYDEIDDAMDFYLNHQLKQVQDLNDE